MQKSAAFFFEYSNIHRSYSSKICKQYRKPQDFQRIENPEVSLRRGLAAHGRILYDACGDSPGGFVLMGLVAAHVVVVVDEADFHHDGGHGRVAQDEEARPLFQPPVGQVEDGLDVGLDAVAQEQALGRIGNEGFRARGPLIEGVEMKGHEYVRFGGVGLSADSVQIVGLPQDDGDAVSLQIGLDGLGQLIGQVAFAQVQGGVDRPAVQQAVVAWIEIDFHRYSSS